MTLASASSLNPAASPNAKLPLEMTISSRVNLPYRYAEFIISIIHLNFHSDIIAYRTHRAAKLSKVKNKRDLFDFSIIIDN